MGPTARQNKALEHAVALVREVCMIADTSSFVAEAHESLTALGVCDAVRAHDNAVLFDWLFEALNFQGVSNAIAAAYLEEHGSVSFGEVELGLTARRLCSKLGSYWQFTGCGYRKSLPSCAEPLQIHQCPLPRHDLRHGGLNQSAYSLFLFFRDIAANDFVGWLDRQLAEADQPRSANRPEELAQAVVEPMTCIHGVSYKVLNMSLSGLLLAGDPERELWRTAGSSMIVVDTLIHNWLHRTGILSRFGAGHAYGPRCYAPDGCASILRRIAGRIDARSFNPDFPKLFPRFVQYCVWWFCAESGFNQCNGNRIDDRHRCDQRDCPVRQHCRRMPLRPLKQEHTQQPA